jgi:hypothetical protein
MLSLKIVTRRKNDSNLGFPEITIDEYSGEAILYGASILEAGMTNGKTSVRLVFEMRGKYVVAQTSADIMLELASVLQGANSIFTNSHAEFKYAEKISMMRQRELKPMEKIGQFFKCLFGIHRFYAIDIDKYTQGYSKSTFRCQDCAITEVEYSFEMSPGRRQVIKRKKIKI